MPVGLEPVQGGARAPCPVHRRGADQDDLVGQAEDPGHGRMQQAGPAVGEADRVVVLQHLGDVAVVPLAERHRHRRVPVGGEDLEPARGLRRVGPDVRVPVDLVPLVQQVADRGRRFQPELVGQRAPVGVGVDRDHPVPAQRGQRGTEAHGGRGLADAAFQAQHRDPVVPAGDRGAGPGDQVPAAALRGGLGRADQAAGHLEDRAAPSAGRGPLPPGQQQVSGQAVRGHGARRGRRRFRPGFQGPGLHRLGVHRLGPQGLGAQGLGARLERGLGPGRRAERRRPEFRRAGVRPLRLGRVRRRRGAELAGGPAGVQDERQG